MREKKAIGMNFIVGSATTYQGKPQSFNVIYVDPVTVLPTNFETHAFDLEYANQHDEPKWDLKYNYIDEYNLPDMSPQSFMDHSNKIYQDEAAAIQYRTNRYVGGPGQDPSAPLSFKDRMELYCQTISNDFDEW